MASESAEKLVSRVRERLASRRAAVDCHWCGRSAALSDGVVDVGGLKFCLACWEQRSARTELPCAVCGHPTRMVPNPLTVNVICTVCNLRADLRKAWRDARNREPCDRCKSVTEHHHPTVYGQNLCQCCHERLLHCTQVYPGDRGWSFCASKPSVPAALLPLGSVVKCAACGIGLDDPRGLCERFRLPAICAGCDGPEWWDAMEVHR